jgi:hypothetical protein
MFMVHSTIIVCCRLRILHSVADVACRKRASNNGRYRKKYKNVSEYERQQDVSSICHRFESLDSSRECDVVGGSKARISLDANGGLATFHQYRKNRVKHHGTSIMDHDIWKFNQSSSEIFECEDSVERYDVLMGCIGRVRFVRLACAVSCPSVCPCYDSTRHGDRWKRYLRRAELNIGLAEGGPCLTSLLLAFPFLLHHYRLKLLISCQKSGPNACWRARSKKTCTRHV